MILSYDSTRGIKSEVSIVKHIHDEGYIIKRQVDVNQTFIADSRYIYYLDDIGLSIKRSKNTAIILKDYELKNQANITIFPKKIKILFGFRMTFDQGEIIMTHGELDCVIINVHHFQKHLPNTTLTKDFLQRNLRTIVNALIEKNLTKLMLSERNQPIKERQKALLELLKPLFWHNMGLEILSISFAQKNVETYDSNALLSVF